MPCRQRLHWPQPAWISTLTRSPIANSSTSGPSAATVPIYSWPGVKFLLKGRPPWMLAGEPEWMISRSVAQIATASMRTSTSARAGTGHRLVAQGKLVRVAEHPGFHPVGDGIVGRRRHARWPVHGRILFLRNLAQMVGASHDWARRRPFSVCCRAKRLSQNLHVEPILDRRSTRKSIATLSRSDLMKNVRFVLALLVLSLIAPVAICQGG